MKLVQVIPIPVTYSRNLKTFLAERSWIYYSWQSTSLSLSLFEEVSNNWNEEARWYPAARYFREFILVAVFSRLDDHRPSYLGPRGKSAKPRKMPHENIGPLFTAKDGGAIFKEEGAIVEKFVFGTDELLVEKRYSRHLVLCYFDHGLWYKLELYQGQTVTSSMMYRNEHGLTTSEDPARA